MTTWNQFIGAIMEKCQKVMLNFITEIFK